MARIRTLALLASTALTTRVGMFEAGGLGPLQAIASPALDKDGFATNLDERSADNMAMLDYWDQVDAIVRGAKAIRDGREKYLPKFPDESDDDYNWRLKMTKFTNVFRDIVEGLASRPFEAPIRVEMKPDPNAKPVEKPKPEVDPATGQPKPVDPSDRAEKPEDEIPEQIATFIQDVDGAYNSITEIGATLFFQAIVDAVTWIFVDYPNAPKLVAVDGSPKPRSVADEQSLGLRPFWSHVLARNVLEARSTLVNGQEALNYVRVLEDTENGRFVRIMYRDPAGARWELWKQDKSKSTGSTKETKWTLVDNGDFTIGLIPMVPVVIGRRRGRTQYYFPTMLDAADLQIELYQQESALKFIKNLAAFPMLAGQGVSPQYVGSGTSRKAVPIRVAPMAALYAPPDGKGTSGSWELLEPSATTLTFLQTDVEKTIAQLRELGRNPLTAQSGNLTVVTTMVAAKKGNSAVQMWAFSEENSLDIALYYSGLWYGLAEPIADRLKAKLFTDFDIDSQNGEAATTLLTMRDKGDLSQRTLWREMQRRDFLSADFNADDEEQALLDEGPSDSGTMIDPATGKLIAGVPSVPAPDPNNPGGNKPPANNPPFGGN